MKEQKSTRIGFTLIEMLVVLAVIVLLASLILPAVTRGLQRAKQTKCISQLRGLGFAWNRRYLDSTASPYTSELDAVYPWLSAMVPETVDDPALLVCPSDPSGGAFGSKPVESSNWDAVLARYGQSDSEGFEETDDLDNHPDVDRCSYMYEFCDAPISWGWEGYILGNTGGDFATENQVDMDNDGQETWREVKLIQLKYGDTFSLKGYDRGKFPLVRCFHHYDDRPVQIRNLDDPDNPEREVSVRVLNLAVAGNVFISGLQWEYPLVTQP